MVGEQLANELPIGIERRKSAKSDTVNSRTISKARSYTRSEDQTERTMSDRRNNAELDRSCRSFDNESLASSSSEEEDSEEVKSYNEEEDEFPEGGLEAWLVTLGCFCGLIPVFGVDNITSVFEEYLEEHQLSGFSPSSIGWIFSIFNFVCFASGIFSGTYFDRNGFKKIVGLGAIIHAAGLFAMANSTKYWHFILSYSIVCAFGNGIALSPLVSCPAHYFKERRGLATACATIGGSIGGGILPLILRKMFSMTSKSNPYYGFVWGIRTLAFINLFLLSMAVVLGKERLPHTKDGPVEPTIKQRMKHIYDVYLIGSFDAKGLLDPVFFFCVAAAVLSEVSLSSVTTYFSSYARTRGVSQEDSYNLIMVLNFCGIPGRWIPGRLSDSFGRFNVAIVTIVMLSILMLVSWLPFGNDLTSLYVIAALYGFFSGSIFSLIPVCIGQVSKTSEFGKRYSTGYFIVALTTLYAVPIAGAIIGGGSHQEYQHYIVYCAVASLAGAACYAVSRHLVVGFTWKYF
ncbi:hypothetical protein KAFR_0F02880 [Kazachstania africana CBS 2517]|uniref:Major facilitator superfamily (MFS) profile domain-containing protein n=1 Tax=Kazachstania africana (strain ATCC 22294 / BCRC 22015 / CBS 2517 / CECT 1963 / NBRC 1671 / NRRL Y-8276) TaxID=1071382 RepID=H2AWY4_KAZAF|nr:hypothetical protein KAFR_0F02880 [Kazachstania africana CBS 2517]CCF58884.1 hypothetical protein KAFR_0F02880 [Kazachstania africana CBS 2517]